MRDTGNWRNQQRRDFVGKGSMRKMGWKLEGRQDVGKQRMKGRQSGQEGHTHTDLKVRVSKVCVFLCTLVALFTTRERTCSSVRLSPTRMEMLIY